MIQTIDERLEKWVRDTLEREKVEVSLAAPAGDAAKQVVHLYLMEVLPTPPLRTPKRPPLQLTLRYLVAVSGSDAHRLLGELAFAALDDAELEVEPEGVPLALWTALGCALRPSFILRVPLKRERPQPAVPRVRVPLIFHHVAMGTLHGSVVGPGDQPIMGARVELPGFEPAAHTDADGRFRLPGVPVEPAPKGLRVQAKGCDVWVDLAQAARSNEPLKIYLKDLED